MKISSRFILWIVLLLAIGVAVLEGIAPGTITSFMRFPRVSDRAVLLQRLVCLTKINEIIQLEKNDRGLPGEHSLSDILAKVAGGTTPDYKIKTNKYEIGSVLISCDKDADGFCLALTDNGVIIKTYGEAVGSPIKGPVKRK